MSPENLQNTGSGELFLAQDKGHSAWLELGLKSGYKVALLIENGTKA